MQRQTQEIAGPRWDNTTEYQSFADPRLLGDCDRIAELIGLIATRSEVLRNALQTPARASQEPSRATPAEVSAAQDVAMRKTQALTLLGNVRTFAACAVSVDSHDDAAKELVSRAQSLSARIGEALQPLTLWQTSIDDASLEQYLAAPHTESERFQIGRRRLLTPFQLPLDQEQLLKGLEVHGPLAWGNLYSNLSGSLVCEVQLGAGAPRKMGVAEASALLESADAATRRSAYDAINAAWRSQEEACSASINSLAGWRLELCRKRSHSQKMHYLDSPFHQSCMSRATLESMMATVMEGRELAREVVRLQARALGLPKLHPADLFAPPPTGKGESNRQYTFDEAIHLIKNAFAGVHPEMSEFVDLMVENKWIEASVGPAKRPGAYCTKFLKSRTPRVYMTYTGGMRDVTTLAHELGHAFHNWVMRDLPLNAISYPMTLAETASISAQTVVNEALAEAATSEADLLGVLWADGREIEAFLINVPSRFAFEQAFYDERQKRSLSSRALNDLMASTWRDWYGDSLSEANESFWASKLHFHIAELSFYNFPYVFGYLFSLGVYAQRQHLGEDFYGFYVKLLRDTGGMTVEELASKHLDADLTKRDFWQRSLTIIERKVSKLRQLVSGQ